LDGWNIIWKGLKKTHHSALEILKSNFQQLTIGN